VPNAQTRAAMEEARAMAKARTARFDSADALIDDLENALFHKFALPPSLPHHISAGDSAPVYQPNQESRKLLVQTA
jgi:hypothetical protein